MCDDAIVSAIGDGFVAVSQPVWARWLSWTQATRAVFTRSKVRTMTSWTALRARET